MSDNRSSFTNAQILSWLEYFAKKAGLDIEKIKLIDISKKQKNLIPTIETHKRVLVFADAGDPNFFFNLWDYGLGDCDIWFKTGLTPEGGVNICKLSEMIDTEITGPSIMLIFNPNSRSSYRIGMQNDNFSQGSVRYVASEIRSIIVNKLHLDDQDTICIISGESIAVESAMIASDGQIIAVEYNKHDRYSMEENINKFGLTNVIIVDDTSRASMRNLPVPSLSFIVATERFEEEVQNLLKINPQMKFVVYTLELDILSSILRIFEKYHISRSEVIQISMSKLNRKNVFEAKPAPWILSGEVID
ncbi:MAG TPA: precorrin-6B methylase [Candidatus Anaerobutyricum stercoripullorum]|uniref:Precorrin-6B methylase n=1 Tax=Candidatus Anaerobutyricum stercoripullorum TaxID=2838456 RepID=A0A9D2BEM6_9FIRM|nr:precorrin-6B methylase [Candidatus Anaerobutyricum stercoripullorum]